MSEKDIKQVDISQIKDPTFLGNLSYADLNYLCKDIRDEIIYSTSINGGHLSSNLGTVESTIALHRCFDFKKDKLLFDVGHQCYTHKILTGRKLNRLRKKDGVSGFPKICESEYDSFEGGHSSNSLSNALGMAISRDLKNEKYDIVCYIGDASISNGLAFEALNDTLLTKHKIIIILNENGMSISKTVGKSSLLFSNISTLGIYNKFKIKYRKIKSLGKLGNFIYNSSFAIKNFLRKLLIKNNIFVGFGLSYIGVIDGHNIKKMEKALLRAKKCSKTCVVHIKTIKGCGYKKAEDDDAGYYHGVNAFDIKSGLSLSDDLSTWSYLYAKEMENILEKNKDTLLLCPGTLIGSKMETIKQKYNDRVIDVGIAEEHSLSMAAGIALNGYHPYLSIFSTFLQRGFDEISHDIARMKIDVTLLIDRSGLVGADGETHQGIFDDTFLYMTPNTTVCFASNSFIASQLMKESLVKHNGIFAIRYPKGNFYNIDYKTSIKYGKWEISYEEEKNDVAIISYGPVINDIISYNLKLKKRANIYNAIYQCPFDKEVLLQILKQHKKIIIYNVYGLENGFNSLLLNYINSLGMKKDNKIISLAIPKKFIKHQTVEEALKEEKLDLDSLFKYIE